MEAPLGPASKLFGAVSRQPLTFRFPRHGCLWSPHRRSRSHHLSRENPGVPDVHWKIRREQASVHRTNWLATVQDSTSWSLLPTLIYQNDTACEFSCLCTLMFEACPHPVWKRSSNEHKCSTNHVIVDVEEMVKPVCIRTAVESRESFHAQVGHSS